MRIYKYVLEQTDKQTVETPQRAQALHVGEQNGELCLWAAVDPSSPPMKRPVRIVGTGQEFGAELDGEDLRFLGTVQMSSGLVWHVFVESIAP